MNNQRIRKTAALWCVTMPATAFFPVLPARADETGLGTPEIAQAAATSQRVVSNYATPDRIAVDTRPSGKRISMGTPAAVQILHIVSQQGPGVVARIVPAGPTVRLSAELADPGAVTVDRAEAAGPFLDFRESKARGLPLGLPLDRAVLTSRFGMRRHPVLGGVRGHSGIDLAAPAGTPVFATGNGVVSRASWFGSYGLFVAVSHADGMQSRYAHLSRLNVSAGQTVRQGDVIGFVGSTGRSTGPHLHYEVRHQGRALDPLGR